MDMLSLVCQNCPNILNSIVADLDDVSASALAHASSRFMRLCSMIHRPGILAPYSAPLVTGHTSSIPAVSFSPASSPSSQHSDFDSLASTDTDMTSSPEEDEDWEFEVTPDMMRRLSALPQRNHGATLPTLPTELQLEVFSYLDQIDSCCLGLTSPNLYVVYRAIHGTKMPLNTRRIGPNKLEAAWEVVGKQECKQCGIYRCELHTHIQSWMPKELEYCALKNNFGLRAPDGSKPSCIRGKPNKPHRCGRHPLRTTSVHQDDSHFNLPH